MKRDTVAVSSFGEGVHDLSGLPLHEIERRHVAAYMAEIATGHGPIAANRARASLSGLYSWAMREGLAEANPVVGTNRLVPERSRERVLSDHELKAIWAACGMDDYGRIVRLLILIFPSLSSFLRKVDARALSATSQTDVRLSTSRARSEAPMGRIVSSKMNFG